MKVIIFITIVCMLSGCRVRDGLYHNDKDILNTVWELKYENATYGERKYEIIFQKNGKLLNTHPNELTKDDDEWKISGNKIFLYFNKRFATYQGVFIDKNNMQGEASSKSGGNWNWEAKKIK